MNVYSISTRFLRTGSCHTRGLSELQTTSHLVRRSRAVVPHLETRLPLGVFVNFRLDYMAGSLTKLWDPHAFLSSTIICGVCSNVSFKRQFLYEQNSFIIQ